MNCGFKNGKFILDGLTWFQWASQLFKMKPCAKCGKGVRGHQEDIEQGQWVAKCKV